METETSHQNAKRSAFVDAVLSLKRWVENRSPHRGPPGWEADYEHWPSLTRAYSDLLDSGTAADWDGEVIDLLLYALARDNEMEVLKEELVLRPEKLVALAHFALSTVEVDAKWQIADALGSVVLAGEEVAPMIERFLQDPDEYVSRRALLALERRPMAQIDLWAIRAWNTDHEYQRMAALHAWDTKSSPLLPSYLDLAEADGREYLVTLAKNIRSRRAGN